MSENTHILRYSLRKKSGEILGKNNRIFHCGHTPITKGNISVIKSADNKAYYNNLQSCGNVWLCPVCSNKIAIKRREEVQRIMYHYIGMPGVHIGFLTLTVSHQNHEKFIKVKERLLKGWKAIQQSRQYRELCYKYRHLGDIRNMEVRVNKKNGWHPHLHIAVFSKCNAVKLYRFGAEIINIWLQYHGRNAGSIGQSFSLIYNQKGISNYITKMNELDGKWNAASEMTLSHLKTAKDKDKESYSPFDLLMNLQDEWCLKKFKAYAFSIKGTRQLTFSKGVRNMHKLLNGEKTDLQLANEKENGEVVCKIERNLWKAIARKSLQAYVLQKLQKEHITALILFLIQHEIYADFSEKDKMLKSCISPETLYRCRKKIDNNESIYEAVPAKERDYAMRWGMKVNSPKRNVDGKILNPGRPVTRFKLHGEPIWRNVEKKWLGEAVVKK